MSDPAAAGMIVPAGGGGSSSGWTWPNSGPRFGDMVWGKVKSHPWWPGHVYSITLSDNAEVHRGQREGLVLVAFFGDSSYGWFEPHEIVPFEEHFAEKVAQGVSTRSSFAAAVAEAVDEVARRAALGLLCSCPKPDAFRPHPLDARYLLVDVPGFDTDADYHPDQIAAARDRFVPRKALDFLLDAAVKQQDAADAAAQTLPGMEMAGLLKAYRRATFVPYDETYSQAFGVSPEKARAAEEKAAAERSHQRARPLSGKRKTPTDEAAPTPASAPASGRRRGGAAARLMEKIVPGAAAMKSKGTKKDQYLLKRRDPPPEPAVHRPAPLPDAPPPALEDGPPGFGADPPTPPHPGSTTVEDEEFMLQRRAPPPDAPPPPPAAQATEDAGAAGPKKAAKPKKARKREQEEAAAGPADAGEPKKKTKKKKLADVEGGAASKAPPASSPPPKVVGDLDALDLKQVVSDLPLASVHGAERGISETARTFVLAFRSKNYKKSYENDPPEEPKKSLSLDKPLADGQPPKKKKLVVKPGVKRGPSDRQEEMTVKKKAKLEKIKSLASEKKAAGLEQKVAAARPAMKDKAEAAAAAARKKEPAAAPRIKMPSPTALMMKFPMNTTLPSVASLKARFARFGPLDVDGIRVYWRSNMCRVIYRFKSDAETALKYARNNPMFGQVDAQFHIKEVENEKSGSGVEPPPAPDAPSQRSDLRLMETAPFRPGTSGNGSPLPMSRAVPARTTAVGQMQPKSILKKSTADEGGSTMREGSRVKFMLDAGDSKLEPPPSVLPTSSGNGAESGAPVRVGFAPQPPARTLQPPMRATQQQQLQPPRAAVTQQQLPPPPPYQPGVLPPQGQLPYPPRYNDGMAALPGQPPFPYQPRAAVFPGQQPPYLPRNGDSQPQQHLPRHHGAAADDVPAWKRSKEEFQDEVWRVMTGIAKMVEPLTDKNGFFPYHLFGSS